MRRKDSQATELEGVAFVDLIVSRDLRWLFREQSKSDFGIDAHIEVVEDDEVTGKLLAVQIKSGDSYFKQPSADGWRYRPSTDHVRYWKAHSLPVIVVLYNPTDKRAYWQEVNGETLERSTRGGWFVVVPNGQKLSSDSAEALSKIAAGDAYILRIRQLQLALPWIRLLNSGRRLLVEVQEWVNKTSGRGSIRLVSVDEGGDDRIDEGEWAILLGLRPYGAVLPQLFAWADVGAARGNLRRC
jgi:hypothetical protein